MQAMAIPIVPGKLDAWRSWVGDLNGAKGADFAASNERHELTVHRALDFVRPTPTAATSWWGAQCVTGQVLDSYMGAMLKWGR